jgi:hypothetical protein
MTQAEHVEWKDEDYSTKIVPKLEFIPPALAKVKPWNPSKLTSAQKFSFRDMTDCYMSSPGSLDCKSALVAGVQYNNIDTTCDFHENKIESRRECLYSKPSESILSISPPWGAFLFLANCTLILDGLPREA